MVSVPEWEYTYRWPQIAGSLTDWVEELEARDQSLEDHLAQGYGLSTCFIQFGHQYRWSQILQEPLEVQAELLEANMQALEQAVADAGGCTLEFPYRWAQFLPGLTEGEDWAIACAEENDRAIEERFNQCTCGGGIAATGLRWNDAIVDGAFAQYIMPEAGTIAAASDRVLVSGITGGGTYRMDIYVNEFIVQTFDVTGAGYYTPDADIVYVEGDFFRVEFSLVSGVTATDVFFYFGPEVDVTTIVDLTPVYP